MAEAPRVALIDDHGLCRRGLAELLELRAGMMVVATTGNPEEGIELIQAHKPDLAVIDLRMPQLDGLRVLRGLRGGEMQVRRQVLVPGQEGGLEQGDLGQEDSMDIDPQAFEQRRVVVQADVVSQVQDPPNPPCLLLLERVVIARL